MFVAQLFLIMSRRVGGGAGGGARQVRKVPTIDDENVEEPKQKKSRPYAGEKSRPYAGGAKDAAKTTSSVVAETYDSQKAGPEAKKEPLQEDIDDYHDYQKTIFLRNKMSAKDAQTAASKSTKAGAQGVETFANIGNRGTNKKNVARD